MKIIKKTKKLIALFLTTVFMLPIVLSCSDVDYAKTDNTLDDYNTKASKIVNAVEAFNKNSIAASKIIGGVEITQELIDEQAIIMGYQAGDFQLSMFNQIMDKYSDVINEGFDTGFDNLLNEYNLNNFTKLKLKDIASGRWTEDLQNNPEFNNISSNEKEMLQIANAYTLQLNNNAKTTFGSSVGAFVGLVVGGFFCNVWCALGGAILGAIIGGSK